MYAFKVDFIVTLLRMIDTSQATKMFLKAIVGLYTLRRNIWILHTNYRHIMLAPTFLINIPKFHDKIRG